MGCLKHVGLRKPFFGICHCTRLILVDSQFDDASGKQNANSFANHMVLSLQSVILFYTIASLLSFRRAPALQPLATFVRRQQLHQPTSLSMRGVKKENLPEKVCIVCHRPFTWRKKWESCWDEVTTCSKSCNRKRRASQQASNRAARTTTEAEDSDREQVSEMNEVRSLSVMVETELEEDEHDDDTTIEASATEDLDTDWDTARLLLEDGFVEDLISETTVSEEDDPKMARKLAKKQMKALRRLKRQGLAPDHGQKPCGVCTKSSDLLIRCTIDATEEWKMVCGTCWRSVSGGVVDGDADHPHYRYGGLWKNRARRS